MNKISTIAIAALIFILSCESKPKQGNEVNHSAERLIGSVSWFQQSSEMTALFYQGFNIAKLRVDEAIKSKNQKKPLAVVVDIDETMLDNSPYDANLIINGDSAFDWYAWTKQVRAKALPGALEFAKYAESRQVSVFYVTNRSDLERIPTLKNLQIEGFPFATEENLLTKSDPSLSTGNTSSKEARRNKIAEKYEIILLIGDNLNDFSEVFEDRSVNNGKDAVLKNKELFGTRFIILPNPVYGAWEKPLYDYIDTLSEQEKTQKMKAKLVL